MNRQRLHLTSMRALLVFSLLIICIVSIEQRAAPPLAQAATPVSVSAGDNHTCGVRSDGSLVCWGAGTTNTGDYPDYGQATPPAGSFSQVSAGGDHTCGVRSDGSLACWGWNQFGQATPPTGSFTQVSAGDYHTCGVRSDGTGVCWGLNSYGKATPPTGSFTQVSAGYWHTCGVRSDGSLACWGDNSRGQATPPAGAFTQISAGDTHTCGLRSDGSLACWGDNNVYRRATPPAGSFTQVSAGVYHTCGVRSDGTGVCWSDGADGNFYGQAPSAVQISPAGVLTVREGSVPPALSSAGGLGGPYTFTVVGGTLPAGLSLNGDGTWTENTPAPVGDYSFSVRVLDKGGLLGVVQRFTLRVFNTITAITDDTPDPSTVGQPASLQYAVTPLEAGTPTGSVTVTVVQEALRLIQVSAGAAHTCGLKGDGSLACWGDNEFGQASSPAGSFSQVDASDTHTCGVKSDSTLACWGDTRDGRATPPAGSFSQVSAGNRHTCGLKSDGSLACWGNNRYGQATPPNGTFTQVSAGGDHTCGLKSDGSLACWGINDARQASPPAGSFTLVSAGFSHTCGLRSDGSLACWGYNESGQASPPAGSFTQVSAGLRHTCGVRSDGSLACWGAGTTDTGAESNFGQSIPPAGSFSQVSAGGFHTCGVRSDGSLACWGAGTTNTGDYPDYGQATPPPPTTITNSAETCTATVSAGGCSVMFTSVGLKYLTASYSGDSAFSASESLLISHTVKVTTTTTIIAITPRPAGIGQAVIVSYTVASAVEDLPGGLVTVTAGADTCTGLATAGACRLFFTSLGLKSFTATYTGDVAFYGSVSAAVTHMARAEVYLPLISR